VEGREVRKPHKTPLRPSQPTPTHPTPPCEFTPGTAPPPLPARQTVRKAVEATRTAAARLKAQDRARAALSQAQAAAAELAAKVNPKVSSRPGSPGPLLKSTSRAATVHRCLAWRVLHQNAGPRPNAFPP
jgi:hypothetical protein